MVAKFKNKNKYCVLLCSRRNMKCVKIEKILIKASYMIIRRKTDLVEFRAYQKHQTLSRIVKILSKFSSFVQRKEKRWRKVLLMYNFKGLKLKFL